MDVNRYKVHGYDLETVRGKLGAIKSSDKYYHDNHAKGDKETLKPGQNVYIRSAAGAWVPGKIVELVGERSYIVQTKHTVVRRNRKDIRPCGVNHNFQPSAVQRTVDAQCQSEQTDHGFGSMHMGSDPVHSSSSSVHAGPRGQISGRLDSGQSSSDPVYSSSGSDHNADSGCQSMSTSPVPPVQSPHQCDPPSRPVRQKKKPIWHNDYVM